MGASGCDGCDGETMVRRRQPGDQAEAVERDHGLEAFTHVARRLSHHLMTPFFS